jgi:hypothetical protein
MPSAGEKSKDCNALFAGAIGASVRVRIQRAHSLIDPSFRQQIAIKVGSQPLDMAFRGNELFVACHRYSGAAGQTQLPRQHGLRIAGLFFDLFGFCPGVQVPLGNRAYCSWPDAEDPISAGQVRSLGSSSRSHDAPEAAFLTLSDSLGRQSTHCERCTRPTLMFTTLWRGVVDTTLCDGIEADHQVTRSGTRREP